MAGMSFSVGGFLFFKWMDFQREGMEKWRKSLHASELYLFPMYPVVRFSIFHLPFCVRSSKNKADARFDEIIGHIQDIFLGIRCLSYSLVYIRN